jgi:glycosyltransferase involved in cell wall biosynthesis
MQDKPLVSVIMNCFNGEKYLSEAIDSVISQEYNNWELIFWDNLSIDSSAEIFNKYTDKRLKYYLSDRHTNLSEARMLAIEKSKGEIITFLDVDDYWKDAILETQVALYKDDDIAFSCGNFYILNMTDDFHGFSRPTWFSKQARVRVFKKGKFPSGYVLNNLLINYSKLVGLVTLSVRRSAYLMAGGFSSDYHIIGDFDLVMRLAINGKMGSFQEPLAFHRKHDNNESIVKLDLCLQELKMWYNKNSYSLINTNKKAVNIFSSSLLYYDYVNHINDDSFSFTLLVSALKRQPLKNVFKIIIKVFIRKLTGLKV